MLRSVTVDALDKGLFPISGEGALREGVVVWSVDDVDVNVAICNGPWESVYLATRKTWKYELVCRVLPSAGNVIS